MNSDKIVVKESTIHGNGVFANRDIKKGEIVLEWKNKTILSKEDISQLSDKDKDYIIYTHGMYIFMQEPERYVNHSCEPNTIVKDFCDVAIRNIKKGEEITTNYVNTMEQGDSMQCLCKSQNCKKTICI